jgi:dihydromonapterin reductase / dihydrofolate reductase
MKYIFITGASSKIGEQITKYYLNKGDYVIYHYFNNKKQINNKNIFYIKCDFSNLNAVENLFDKIKQKFSKLDLLINNASIFQNDDLITEDIVNKINYEAPKLLSQLYFNSYKEGNIINITDYIIFSHNNDLNKKYYYESKKKLADLIIQNTLNFDNKFRVNGIALGAVSESIYCDGVEFKNKINSTIIKKKVDINDIILAIEFLFNNTSICGHNIVVDCGAYIYTSVNK